MTASTLKSGLARGVVLTRGNASVLALFSTTLFLSALLLFSVQPVVAKMVLPKLGGSPSVWAVSLCFFQAVLLAGYCYAHALNRFATGRIAPLAHLLMLSLAYLALPFGLPAGASEPPEGGTYLWLVGILAVTVGLPFFALSAHAPLLQAWFARSGHPHAADPYFLYGASNCGSLAALLSYPVVVEPLLALPDQARIWTGAFLTLGFLISACALAMLASRQPAAFEIDEQPSRTTAAPAVLAHRLTWIGLAFVPSGLLVAFTSYLTTDIASAPFLWVMPLAIFLATFILVFRERPVVPHALVLAAQPVLVTLVVLGLSISGNVGWTLATVAGVPAFLATTLACHKELYDRRPASVHLTEFYLWMSLGGVLGGVFAAILAPQIFNAVYEYPLLLLLGLLCRPGISVAMRDRVETREAAQGLVAGLAVLLAFAGAERLGLLTRAAAENCTLLLVIICGFMMLLQMRRPLRQAAFAALAGLAVLLLPSALNKGHSERSFFGVHRVVTSSDGQFRMLMHGTTNHGAQRIADSDGRPVTDADPATYYYPDAPMTHGIAAARAATGKTAGDLSVGVVGLGTGSLACYGRDGERWRYFEIDPVVVRIARDPKLFNFLSRCRPGMDVVTGDARLTLAREPAAAFNYLVIDAFSSDAVPVHLLTREALTLYLDKLTPDGLLALHVSNRHMDLVSVAVATAKSIPGTHVATVLDHPTDPGFDRASSHVVFVSRSSQSLAPLAAARGGRMVIDATDAAPWTDDYSDVLTAIWRNYTGAATRR